MSVTAQETWHQLDVAQVLERLGSDPRRGLDEPEAARRQAEHGPNELIETGGRGPWAILGSQLRGSMMVLLFAAAAVSLFLGEAQDAVVILAIIVLNALLGFWQELRAEKAMAALKQLAVPRVRVHRGGAPREISAKELVPGDVLLLAAGQRVPADARLVEHGGLRVEEAALTGESAPADKDVAALRPSELLELPLGDRRNMVYMGTLVTYGRATAVVTATGMATELGHIARLLQSVEREPTPLQRRLRQLGQALTVAALVLVAVVCALGLWQGESLRLVLMTALSLAVAAVPEGLPAVATVTLAIGARRMLVRQALIRRLPAVETLGSVTVICSDKTGTLTENRMTAMAIEFAGRAHDLDEHGRSLPIPEELSAAWLLLAAALCNDAETRSGGQTEDEVLGDPTEVALVRVAARFGVDKAAVEAAFPRASEAPFDSQRKRMTTVHRRAGDAALPIALTKALAAWPVLATAESVAFCKGAVDALLEVADRACEDGVVSTLDAAGRERILDRHARLAAVGVRVLGLACRPLVDGVPADPELAEQGLIFLGMVGMIDPPRTDAAVAVARCREAGIRPVMITGDHPLTARQIAHQVGIAASDAPVLSGAELSALSDAGLADEVERVSVFARVSPEHKLRIVRALEKRGHVVAMTGDGVNDAPALRQADIGVAMGQSGTDVAKEAAEMVLLDDHFATIVNAVEEGRTIYDNIRKFIKYTLASNTGEIIVMLGAPFLGLPLPLLPLQILWINLVTDGLPGLALGLEPAERDIMRRPPERPDAHIFGQGLGWDIVWIGALMGVVSLLAGWGFYALGPRDETWRTVVFTVLTLSQMGNALALRSFRDSFFTLGYSSNKPLAGAVFLTLIAQMAVVHLPFLRAIFRTEPLTLGEWGLCLLLASIVFWAVELKKKIVGRSEATRTDGEIRSAQR